MIFSPPRFRSSPASALLLSFFMMTVLLLASISVSTLVLRDTVAVRSMVSGVQALYAAEGVTELGLYSVKENLPGYEPSFLDYSLNETSIASAQLSARGTVVPCEGQSEDGWGVLDPNESVQLALFAQTKEDGSFLKNTSFKVEFFVGDEEENPLFNDMTQFLTEQDVLRWKILGLYYAQTEAISEYIPLDTTNNRTSPENPSVFGPGASGTVPDGYKYAKFYDSGTPSHFYPSYSIATFLENHDYNYLVLTNIIQGAEDARIYYRLHWVPGSGVPSAELGGVVCEYTEINALADSTGIAEVRQVLQTLVREGENLPVFDFVLYHTRED
jgi:hypothetical protein